MTGSGRGEIGWDGLTRSERQFVTLGGLLYVVSSPLLLFVIATASPGPFYEEGTREWWAAVLETVFRPSGGGPVMMVVLPSWVAGVLLLGWGLRRTFLGLRVTTGRLMGAVLVVGLGLSSAPLGVLMAFAAPGLLALAALLRRPLS